MLRISVVTPCLNSGRFIRQTIDSVLAQCGPFEIDYVVVDGGSRDDTLAILKGYRDRLRYFSGPDRGHVDALNRGMGMCSGDIVGWLNSDDVLLPGAFEMIASAFEGQTGLDWVHGRCLLIDQTGNEIQSWISWYKHQRCLRHSFRRLLLENYISQMTVYWRRELLAEVGMLDGSMPLAFDYDLWLRLALRNAPGYLPVPLAAFRRHPASLSARNYPEMFRQELQVAERYSVGFPHLLPAKRLRMRLFGLVYNSLDLGQDRRTSVKEP